MRSPTQRSLKHMRGKGYVCEVIEKFVYTKQGGFRKDVFGGDILAVNPESKDTVIIQATSHTNHSSRKKKALANSNLQHWLGSGNRFLLQSWNNMKLREEELTLNLWTDQNSQKSSR